ncbi:unnamed protein product [Linum tenue]|uniref:Uncharacterized protein n=1 Tax=Linum tenue TaxID=586396 RepID=A0AAV0NAQ0_9ROSI|nr:unnamed protein product [Linum tenue]
MLKRVASFRNVRSQEISKLVAAISEFMHGNNEEEAVNMRRLLVPLASRVTSRSAFGELENEIGEGFLAVVDEIVKAHNGFGLSDLFPSLKFIPVVTGFLRKQSRCMKRRHLGDEMEDIVDILLNLQETGDLPLTLTTDAIKAVVLVSIHQLFHS